MKLFLASALPDDVRWAADNGLLDAVVTSPALLTAAHAHDDRDRLLELCRLSGAPVFASVRATNALDAYRDARELARISDQIVVTLPLVEDVLPVVQRLARDGIPVAATLVYTAAQSLLAARAGVSRLFLSVGQLELNGLDGVSAVREARQVLDAANEECDLVALYPATASQFSACAAAGADAAAVTCDVLRSLLAHPLTARGIAQFEQELAARPRLWSAS